VEQKKLKYSDYKKWREKNVYAKQKLELKPHIEKYQKAVKPHMSEKEFEAVKEQANKWLKSNNTDNASIHPRFRIKDDRLFQLKTKVKDICNRMKGTYTKGSADGKTKDDYKSMSLEELQDKAKQGYFELQSDPKLRNHVEIKYPNGKREWIFVEKLARDKYTGDPLTAKGRKIMAAMREKYGAKKGKQVFFASRNKGTIKNVDLESMDSKTKDDLFETIRKIRNSSGAILGTIAIYDAVGEFVVETWNLKSGKDVKKVVKRFPYEGNEDRKAALAMARGFVNTYPDYEFKDSKTKDNEPNQSDIEAAQRGNNMVGMSLVDLDDLIRLMEGKSDFAARVTVAAAKQMIAAKKRMGAKDSTRKVIHHLIKTKQRKVI
jgi:hypothetical protein